ncbi:hypothetical protein BC332_14704 [Capsicum chinense]|nr:hypothetical protein BC332_14704 [Capsicum chinense]
MHICYTNLKASPSEEVRCFIKQLLEISPDILREYLIHLQEHMVNVITPTIPGARNIHVMIEFLLIILTDMPKDFIHHDKLFDLLARVGALIREVSTFIHDLEEKSRNEESSEEKSRTTLDLLKNIELLKEDLKYVYMKAQDSSQCCFPMKDGPLFMHLLLIHLNDLLDSNSYSIALIKEEIRLVKEALEFIRPFFVNVEKGFDKDLCWVRVLDVAYEAKDVIDSIIVRDNCLLHLIFSLPISIEKISLIKEDVSQLPEKIPKNKSVIFVNSPKNPVERKSFTAVDQEYDEKRLLVKLFNQVTGSDLKFSEEIDVADKLRKQLFGKSEVDVMKVIELSYDHLPHQCKPCFLYLASYPKDNEINRDRLKMNWRAEGLVEQTETMSAEEVMEIYLDNLISSSLEIAFNEIGDFPTFKIHDLVQDFCLIKAREEKLFGRISSSDEQFDATHSKH